MWTAFPSQGRAGARCRRYRRSVSPTRPPNRTCPFLSIRLSTGHPLVALGAVSGTGWFPCRPVGLDWGPRGRDVVPAVLVAGNWHLGRPVEPGALFARPFAPPAPPPDLFPGQARVLFAQPADHSPPQVVAEVSEAALRRAMAVVVALTPEDRIERVDERIERQVRRGAPG
jgi:hypothetical protein